MKKDEILYGYQPVIEAMRSGKEIEKLLFQKTMHPGKLHELKKEATMHEIPFQFVPREKLNKLTHQNHQGVVAVVSPISYTEIQQLLPMLYEQGKTPLLLILDKVTDVRNMGAMARSAECAGVDAIIFPAKGSAMINADAIKTSAGALSRIPVCRVSNLKETLSFLKDSGLALIGARENTNTYYHDVDYTIPAALIMGSEEKGISDEFLKLCDSTVSIPMRGEIQSLNVSVAAGILLFEAVRQRVANEKND